MAGFTKVNLRDVEDMAPKNGLGEINEARFAKRALEMTAMGVSYQKLFAGKRNSAGHKHREQEELFVILSGSGKMKLNDETIEVGPLDAIRVDPQTLRGLEAGKEDLEFLIVGAPLLESPDFEFDKEFWDVP
jgi:mannose-6-phosphate isomerase-like protein (cupin superfamily)